MRIAVPVFQGKLSLHFGHCDEFAILDVDLEKKQIFENKMMTAPSHEPGALPRWLNDHNVKLVIAGGMGRRAQLLLEQNGIEVIVGASTGEPEEIATKYLNGSLQTGDNLCDH